jgi:hypothetical protein
MSTQETKKPWQSGGIVTGIIALILAVCEYYGVFIDPELQSTITDPAAIDKITQAETIKGLLTAGIGISFIYFRLRAKRAIEGGAESLKDAVLKPINWIKGLFSKKQQNE